MSLQGHVSTSTNRIREVSIFVRRSLQFYKILPQFYFLQYVAGVCDVTPRLSRKHHQPRTTTFMIPQLAVGHVEERKPYYVEVNKNGH